ncbi:SPOR domain-containing protein [Parabacteroides sp. AM08-6]|uniref:HU domain-containing protein n=1 Tax=Parabacteroides sp. AM08-6 TaxID=2292053 RepID=UPI000EFE6CB5|nr:SPOR domain-containing protein [Parabacteroides sp. AM08-6]RHJ78230.1 SPOR domain-containing protein [Parabacteroides sp. AM08-6]
MLRIITHIERLLLVHDCVIVPKLGGFVLQSVPAFYGVEEHMFRPQRKEISFNVTLQHSDGLLAESYMQMYDINYRQAQLMLDEDTEDMKNSLQQYKKLSMGVLGSFSIGDEGQLVFHPGETNLFSIDSYGLSTFHFPQLVSLQAEKEEVVLLTKQKDTLYIPISRKLIRSVVASAAAVTLFLVVSTPVKDVRQDAYTASFVPTEMVSNKMIIASSQVSEQNVSTISMEQDKSIDFSELKEDASEKVAATSASVTQKPEVLSEPVTMKSNPKMYHIIIASFPSEKQADEYISSVDVSECKHVSKIVRDGKYRIYADKFDNREQAEAYMTTLRANPKYKDAWLFASR